jgi:hypothetical protein
VSEKLRRISEIKTIQQRQGEMRALLDPDLFLAHLKKPEVMRNEANAESSIEIHALLDNSKHLSHLSQKLAKALMRYEKVIKEEFVTNPIPISLDNDADVERIVDDLFDIEDKVLDVTSDFTPYKDLVLAFLGFPELVYLVSEVDDVLELEEALHQLSLGMRNFLIHLHGFFAKTRIEKTYPEDSIENLYVLADNLREHGMRDLAAVVDGIVSEIEKQVPGSRTANILPSRIKVKPLYLTLVESEDKLEDIRSKVKDPDIETLATFALFPVSILRSTLSLVLEAVVKLVNVADNLRNTLSRFGYRSSFQPPTFYRVSRFDYTIEDVIQQIPDELTLSQLLDDATRAIHEMAEALLFYGNYISGQVRIPATYIFKFGDCPVPVYSTIDSGPLVNFATAWLNTICNAIQNGVVTGEDKKSLFGYIADNSRALFKIDRGLTNTVHVLKDRDEWFVEYIGDDILENKILSALWGAVPGVRVSDVDEHGVTVVTRDEKMLPFIGALLGFATGLDDVSHIIQRAEEISPQLALLVKRAFSA